MRWEQFTEKARAVLAEATDLASKAQNPEVSPEHLTLALINQEGGVVPAILEHLQMDLLPITNRLEVAISRLPKAQQIAEPTLSRQLLQVLEASLGQARFFKDDFVSTEHMLAGLLEAKGGGAKGFFQGKAGSLARRLEALERLSLALL